MVRASAKNHPSVAVVVDPARYGDVLAAVAAGGFTLAERQSLAAAAFRHTADYDIAVASWLGNVVAPDDDSGFPGWVAAGWQRADVLRYGENPHQRAALYRSDRPGSTTTATDGWFFAAARTIAGPPMSICSTHSSGEAPEATVSVNG